MCTLHPAEGLYSWVRRRRYLYERFPLKKLIRYTPATQAGPSRGGGPLYLYLLYVKDGPATQDRPPPPPQEGQEALWKEHVADVLGHHPWVEGAEGLGQRHRPWDDGGGRGEGGDHPRINSNRYLRELGRHWIEFCIHASSM